MSERILGLDITPDTILTDLIASIATGNEDSLTCLYDRTQRLVSLFTRRMINDPALAEEAALDVYLQIWKQAAEFDAARGSAFAWILGMARSRSIDCLRRAARLKKQDKISALAAFNSLPGPFEQLNYHERRLLVERAIRHLKPDERVSLELAFFAELTHSEIAHRLGQPLGTIKTRIRGSLSKLRNVLEMLGHE